MQQNHKLCSKIFRLKNGKQNNKVTFIRLLMKSTLILRSFISKRIFKQYFKMQFSLKDLAVERDRVGKRGI